MDAVHIKIVVDTEVAVYLQGGLGAVERVEVYAVHVGIQQLGALIAGIVDAYALDAVFIAAGSQHGFE